MNSVVKKITRWQNMNSVAKNNSVAKKKNSVATNEFGGKRNECDRNKRKKVLRLS